MREEVQMDNEIEDRIDRQIDLTDMESDAFARSKYKSFLREP